MSEPYYIWATDEARERNACNYYRIFVPFRDLSERKLVYAYVDKGINRQEALRAMLTSDIVQFYSIGGEAALYKVKVLKSIKPAIRADGKQFPPVVIYDVDDNTDFVHPMNITFSYLGLRGYPDG